MASPAYAVTEKVLKKNPKATFDDVKKAGLKKGLNVPPVVFGLAKKNLGLASPKTPVVGSGKARKPRNTSRLAEKAPTRERRRSSSAPASTSSIGLDAVIEHVRQIEVDRERKRRVLSEMRDLIDSALES